MNEVAVACLNQLLDIPGAGEYDLLRKDFVSTLKHR